MGLTLQISSFLTTLSLRGVLSNGGRRFFGISLILPLSTLGLFSISNSKIKSQQDFRLALVRELVQSLLDLKASPNCPDVLKASKGRKSVSPNKLLLGKHFAYKSADRDRCMMCSKRKTPTGKKTKDYCLKCEVYLCLGACFEHFHTKAKI